jgi:zinc transporter 1/2/3
MDVFWFKLLSFAIILAAGFLGGVAPLRLTLSASRERHLHWGNAFSGGVFFGVGLLHMIPDAIHHHEEFAPGFHFPMVMFITGIGFILILLLEKVVIGNHEGIGKLLGSRPLYPFMLALILSIHSVVAGSALGLEETIIESFPIFVAIIAHKSAAAFALGISLQRAGLTIKRFVYIILFFSLMTPIGILFGTYFSGSISAGFESMFDALAAGTFLYVAIVGIMEEVFENRKDLWIKSFFIIIGFGLMALLAAII